MLKVIHVITKLELGGAQKVVLMTLDRLPGDRYQTILVSGPEGLLDDHVRAVEGLDVRFIPTLVREIRPLKDLGALIALWRLFRAERPDIVHTHSSKAGILGRWAAWLAGVPRIFHTAHGFGFHDYQGRLAFAFYVWLERLSGLITDQAVMVSRANADRAERLGIVRPGEWILCRDSVAVGEFSKDGPRRMRLREWGVPEDRTVVGMVACFKPQKSPVDFIDVAAEVVGKNPAVHFVMAGDGELRGEVEARIRERGLGEHVTLVGWQRDMPEVYRNLDVFVLTSLWEGQPCVFAEAMASGLPIVATRADGAREAITEGVTGFVCELRDVGQIADRVLRLAADPELRRTMGQRGRERVGEFDIDVSVARLEAAYRREAPDSEPPVAVGQTP